MLASNKTLGPVGLSFFHAALALALAGSAVMNTGCVAGTDETCLDGACEVEPGDEGLIDEDMSSGEEEAVAEAESALCNCTCDGVYDVGVVPESGCPSDVDKLTIYMDDEDTTNGNDQDGWIGLTQSGSNTKFTFCRVPGTSFKPLNTAEPYAVLKLGYACPPGSESFSRTFDNEDTSNDNTYTGNIYPNSSTTSPSKTTLSFCLFRGGSSNMTSFPYLGFNYGIFSRPGNSKSLGEGWVYTDDEDTANGNTMSYSWSILDMAKTTDANQIVNGGSNTTVRMTRVR